MANSDAVRRNAVRREGFPERKSRAILNGHDRDSFEVPPAPHFRESHGIGPTDPIIGMVASLYPIKRPTDLFHAFRIARERYPNLHLIYAGEGRERTSLLECVRTHGLERQVHLLGTVPQPIPVIKHFSIGVLCSGSEGLSNAIMEYMGCGKPTICTRVGGNSELVEDGYNGFLVEVGDIEGMADRILQILSNPSLGQEMGSRAQKRILEDFSVDRMANAYMQLYESLAGGR